MAAEEYFEQAVFFKNNFCKLSYLQENHQLYSHQIATKTYPGFQ